MNLDKMVERYDNQLTLIGLAEKEGLDKGEFSYFLDCGEKLGALLVELENKKSIESIPSQSDYKTIKNLHQKFSSPDLPEALKIVSNGIDGLLEKVKEHIDSIRDKK